MTTNINITVGGNSLIDQAKAQQQSARNAKLLKDNQARVEAEAKTKRDAELARQGLAPDGTSLYGTPPKTLYTPDEPAATSRDVTPQRVYLLPSGLTNPPYSEETYIFYDDLYVNTSNPNQPEAFASYEFKSRGYNISIPTLDGSQTFDFPLFFVERESGVIFYDYREYNSPYDATSTWPSELSGPDITTAPLLTNPSDIGLNASAYITEKINGESRNIQHTTRLLPLKGGEAVILIHCGRWAQVFYSKDVQITWTKYLSQVPDSDPVSYYQNKTVTINKNDMSYGPEFYGNWAKAYLITTNNVKEISCPVAARVLQEIPTGRWTQNSSTGTSFSNGWNTSQYINGTTIAGIPFAGNIGANYVQTPLPSNYGGSPYLAAWGAAGLSPLCYGPTSYTALEKSPESLPLAADSIWTDAEAVRSSIFPNYPIQRYGVKLVPTKETEALPSNQQIYQWATTKPPVNSSTASTKVVARQNNTSSRFESYYRDWNNPDFCRQRALLLGFTEADLTP